MNMIKINENSERNGWLNIYKDQGYTSTHIVRSIKKIFNLRKVGHYGTLDPLASGILPIAIGEATKTIQFINYTVKAYTFVVNWGKETDTCDSEGKVIKETKKRPNKEAINKIINQYFTGKIFQKPPLFSAVKIEGKRAYELARKNIKFEINSREVEIFEFKLLDSKDINKTDFFVSCGPGTYVRSLARDLAKKLGTLGYASEIVRLKNSYFTKSNSLNYNSIKNINKNQLDSLILPTEYALKNYKEIKLEKKYSDMIKDGKIVFMDKYNNNDFEDTLILIKNESKLVSIANLKKGYIIPRRNFNN